MSSPDRSNQGPAASGKAVSFTEFVRSLDDLVPCAGNRPLHLNDSGVAWLVECGAVDLFTVEYQQGCTTSFFKHVLRARQGRILFGADRDGDSPGLGLIGKGLPGSSIRPIPLRALQDKLSSRVIRSAIVTQIDTWIREFSEAVARDIDPRPQIDCLLTSGQTTEAVGILSSAQGVTWIDGRNADAAFLGLKEPEAEESGLMPISPGSWVTLMRAAIVTGRSSRDLPVEDLLFRCLREFHRLVLDSEALNRKLLLVDDANFQRSRSAYRRQGQISARENLFNVVGQSSLSASDAESPLLSALRIIGQYEGVTFKASRRNSKSEAPLDAILYASGVRGRRIRLSETEHWWTGDSGAMLAFRRDNRQPVALIPGMLGRYRCIDPASGTSVKMNAKTSAALEDTAWFVYRALPNDRPAGAKDLWKVASKRMLSDLLQVALTGMGAGLALLVPAMAIGILADRVVPTGNLSQLLHLSGLLVAMALLSLLLNMLRGTAMMRLEGRSTARIIAAIWDRLLGLRQKFFSRFTSGDLMARAMTFQLMRDHFSGIAAHALLSVLFLFPTFALIFFYNTALGWMSLGFGLLALGLTISLGVLQIGHQRRQLSALRKLSGHLFQLINGVGKLRATGATASAYALWARQYRNQKLAEIGISKLNEHLVAFGAAVPALSGAALFAVAMTQDSGALSTGDFLVIHSASMVFFLSISALGSSFGVIAALIPSYEQVQSILVEQPENVNRHDLLTQLSGDVHFDHVSFRYSADGPLILDDISIRAKPGEFIAIVGESGSGKSTLVRLALGLEAPSSGAVYYDGHDISRLDIAALRRHVVSVVMQENTLQAGLIMSNIIGMDESLTVDDAWQAARDASVDKDISTMPMGMYTPMSDNASTVSGGQCQRIRIASALVRKPTVLLLDEATSWLDAESQTLTMSGIEKSSATRIVIAHRLSTIRHANRIYVLQAGRVVQEGSFDELSKIDGPFRTFIDRQIA